LSVFDTLNPQTLWVRVGLEPCRDLHGLLEMHEPSLERSRSVHVGVVELLMGLKSPKACDGCGLLAVCHFP
jgi:hypothetical protein